MSHPIHQHAARALLLAGLALVAGLVATAGAAPAHAVTRRLSFPPQAVWRGSGALVAPSGFSGSLWLQDSADSAFSLGFTLPHDYQPNTPIVLSMLAESHVTNCNIAFRAGALLRAREGHPRDAGSIHAGLEALNATTPFAYAEGRRVLVFGVASVAGMPVRFQFRIVPTPGEFATLQAGDAIALKLERATDLAEDDCNQPARVAGISAVYTRRATAQIPARGRLSLDPFAVFDEEPGPHIQWTGAEPPLHLVNSNATKLAAFAFIVPSDHKPATHLDVEVLWSAAQTGCGFVVSGAHLFRARPGTAVDHLTHSAAGGLEPLDATTPFTLSDADLRLQAPAVAGTTGRFRFRVRGGDGFPALQGGDSVSFSLYRFDGDPLDSCAADLEIAGISIAYDRANGHPVRDSRDAPRGAASREDREAAAATGEATIKTRSLPLSVYAVAPGNANFDREASGFSPSALFSKNGSASFTTGFVLPDDYKANTPLTLRLLVSSLSTNCNFSLLSNALYRARAKHPADAGNASGGLQGHSASTPFLASLSGVTFAAAKTAETTARVDFRITPTPIEFPTLKAGDAVNFSLFRDPNRSEDTCPGDLGLAGLSILYQTK